MSARPFETLRDSIVIVRNPLVGRQEISKILSRLEKTAGDGKHPVYYHVLLPNYAVTWTKRHQYPCDELESVVSASRANRQCIRITIIMLQPRLRNTEEDACNKFELERKEMERRKY